MIQLIKLILLLIISFSFGFGFWYLIFWFISNEPNLFLWNWVIKLLYLIFGGYATEGVVKILKENQ